MCCVHGHGDVDHLLSRQSSQHLWVRGPTISYVTSQPSTSSSFFWGVCVQFWMYFEINFLESLLQTEIIVIDIKRGITNSLQIEMIIINIKKTIENSRDYRLASFFFKMEQYKLLDYIFLLRRQWLRTQVQIERGEGKATRHLSLLFLSQPAGLF